MRDADSLVPPGSRDTRPLLERILDTPHLAQVIPRLQPEVLHRVIARLGLEDSGELVALAAPRQVQGVLDLDLWRSARPGLDAQFDADRFGVWLEVLLESGPSVAARTLAGLDVALVTAALAQHVLVFDPATMAPSGERGDDEPPAEPLPGGGLGSDIGGYQLVARRADAWDAIVMVLTALDREHHRAFHQVMSGCRSLSNSAPEIDGLDNLLTAPEQVLFDLTAARDRRRERLGYATPAEARAFLAMTRQLNLAGESGPVRSPIASAYFRAMDEDADMDEDAGIAEAADAGLADASSAAPPGSPTALRSMEAAAALVNILIDEDVLPRPARALLDAPTGQSARLSRIQSHLQFAHDFSPSAYMARSQEIAFLANTLLAGCSIQARPFTLQEASDAAVAVCNLGLENWPAHWLPTRETSASGGADAALPEGFLVDHDLVGAFAVGWNVLHHQVCLFAAEELIGVLGRLKCGDRETRAGLRTLRAEMLKHWTARAPWRARHAMDVLTSLDLPAWAALLGLIDECPTMHAGVTASQAGARAVSASAFEFIAGNGQLASIRAFMRALPDTLRG